MLCHVVFWDGIVRWDGAVGWVCSTHGEQDALLCEATLRAIHFVTLGHVRNQQRLCATHVPEVRAPEAGAAEAGLELVLLSESVRMYSSKPQVVFFALLCIAELGLLRADGAQLIVRLQVVEWALRVLRRWVVNCDLWSC